MKLRESGMPDEICWESLFDVPLILGRLGIDSDSRDVVELGCGYGTFTLPVAQRISGRVFAFDLEAEMVNRTRQRAQAAGVYNLVCQPRDVAETGYGVPAGSVDGVLMFNILHGENPTDLLRQAALLVKPSGWIWAIHWRYDPATPRGPSLAIRPRPTHIAEWAVATGLLQIAEEVIDLPPWHYGWRLRRLARPADD